MSKKLVIVFFSIAVAGFMGWAAPSEERKMLPMIYPGIGIAEIKLGDQANAVNKNWGEKADEVTKVMIEKVPEFLLLYRDRGILFVCDERGQVQRIVCKSPALLVKGNGLRVGNYRKDLEKAYPIDRPIEKSLFLYSSKDPKSKSNAYRLLIFETKGIAYTLKDNKIVTITVLSSRAVAEKKIFSVVMSVGLSWEELLYISI